jgi:magnesium chelatase subunit D
MREALLILGADPSIGGLLLVGEKGTAKSTAARALAEALPPIEANPCPCHCDPERPSLFCPECLASPGVPSLIRPPFRTVPLGVTEERLLGGLDFEKTMRDGRPALRPGIASEANNGLLYIDEVNLLDPQLAHLLLDAASSGRVVLERDGFSRILPAKVALLGSMNPEEGPLGPQLADRFALSVELKGEADPLKRAEIVRRRLEFEKNPAAFRAFYEKKTLEITENIRKARAILGKLIIGSAARERAGFLARSAGTAGHRADLALCLAARAKFALETDGSEFEIGPLWIDKVARLVIPSRRKPEAKNGSRKILSVEAAEVREREAEKADGPPVFVLQSPEIPPEWKEENFDPEAGAALRVFQSGDDFQLVTPKLPHERGPKERKGRRAFRESLKARGRAFKTSARRLGRPLSLSATLRAAAPRQRERSRSPHSERKVILKPSDFREKVYRLKTGRLVVFVVDSSGSIGTLYRMEEAKAAALSLLTDAYQKRDRVAIVTFYGNSAELLLPPTDSPDLAGRLLATLPSGGKTPLASALALTHRLLKTERAKDPAIAPFIILMTDGRPNIPLDPKKNPWTEVLHFADLLAADPALHFLLIDTDRGAYNEFKLTRELGEHLNAPKISLEDLREGRLEQWLDSF